MLRGVAAAASIAVVAGVGYVFATSSLGPASAPTGTGANRTLHRAAAGITGQGTGALRQLSYGGEQRAPALASDANYTPANLVSLVRRDVANTAGMIS